MGYKLEYNSKYKPQQIISGGQTGADLGGLLAAEDLGYETGGIAPKGYKTEAGSRRQILGGRFKLKESTSSSYLKRTRLNVANSDCTIIFATKPSSGGTKQTLKFCRLEDKPYIMLNPKSEGGQEELLKFLLKYKPNVINIAGNRESVSVNITTETRAILVSVFSSL